MFIAIELPAEELRYQTKLAKNEDMEDAIRYLKTIFWVYGNSDRFNFTREDYIAQVSRFERILCVRPRVVML